MVKKWPLLKVKDKKNAWDLQLQLNGFINKPNKKPTTVNEDSIKIKK